LGWPRRFPGGGGKKRKKENREGEGAPGGPGRCMASMATWPMRPLDADRATWPRRLDDTMQGRGWAAGGDREEKEGGARLTGGEWWSSVRLRRVAARRCCLGAASAASSMPTAARPGGLVSADFSRADDHGGGYRRTWAAQGCGLAREEGGEPKKSERERRE
jgi:hypothetical protein